MFYDMINSRLHPDDEGRFICLAHHLKQWTGGGSAVHVLSDGNYKIAMFPASAPWQTRARLFTNLARFLANGTSLASNPESCRLVMVKAHCVADLDEAVTALFSTLSPFSRDRCQQEYQTLTAAIAAYTTCAHSLAALEDHYEELVKWERCDQANFSVQHTGYQRMWPRFQVLLSATCPPLDAYPQLATVWRRVHEVWCTKASKIVTDRANRAVWTLLRTEIRWAIAIEASQQLDALIPVCEGRGLRNLGLAAAKLYHAHHYETASVRTMIALGERAQRSLDVHEALSANLTSAMKKELIGQNALYEELLRARGEKLREDVDAWRLYTRAAEAWLTDGVEEKRSRTEQLINCFKYWIFIESRNSEFDSRYECPEGTGLTPEQFIDIILGGFEYRGPIDPLTLRNLNFLLKAVSDWREALIRLARGTPSGATSEWPADAIVAMVRKQRDIYEERYHRVTEEVLRDLQGVQGDFSPEDADMVLVCGEERFPVHRAVFARLAWVEDGLFSDFVRRGQPELHLPTEPKFVGDGAPQFTPVLARCLLSYLYRGFIPDSVARICSRQLDKAFAYLWPSAKTRPWWQIAAPSKQDWFQEDLLAMADCELVCADGDYRFHKAVLRTLNGALSSETDFRKYKLTRSMIDFALRLAVGDVDHLQIDSASWETFVRLEEVGNWLFGETLWQETRGRLGPQCLEKLSDRGLMEAIVTSRERPYLRLAKMTNDELERRLGQAVAPMPQLIAQNTMTVRAIAVRALRYLAEDNKREGYYQHASLIKEFRRLTVLFTRTGVKLTEEEARELSSAIVARLYERMPRLMLNNGEARQLRNQLEKAWSDLNAATGLGVPDVHFEMDTSQDARLARQLNDRL